MPTPLVDEQTCQDVIDAVERELRKGARPPGVVGRGLGALSLAATHIGMNESSLRRRLEIAKRAYGLEPDWGLGGATSGGPIQKPPNELHDKVLKAIRSTGRRLDDLALEFNVSKGKILDTIDALQETHLILESNGVYSLQRMPDPSVDLGAGHEFLSEPDNTFLFGVVSDTHLGSKYERLDVLNALYDTFAQEGVKRVFHAGNWIDGEAPFNKYDLLVHGMDGQVRYLAEHYPKREGIVTYAVTGDDHEGWYSRREGVDIGRYAERTMRDKSRNDWVNLGYMEAFIPLVNANSGAKSRMLVAHPGGGTAYALSYSVQRIVESLEGGEKPAIGIWGHYHKLWFSNIRNVWALQPGTTQDQTPFMRSKRLEAHVGGALVKATQLPDDGAITRCRVDLMRWFNVGYYNDRWSRSHDVNLPERTP